MYIYTYVYIHICIYLYKYIQIWKYKHISTYGVATISRLLKITGLFCTISSFSEGSFAKETYTLQYLHIHLYIHACIYKVAKTHRMP